MRWLSLLIEVLLFLSNAPGESNHSAVICNFNPSITAIGRPLASIKTTWRDSINSTEPVLYNVYFNRTSLFNHCEYPTKDAFHTAYHCSQISRKAGLLLECDLTEDIKMLDMRFISESLCIMISQTSFTSNKTCYSIKEYNPLFEPYSFCPAPERFKVLSLKPGTLTVMWDVSRKFVGVEAMKDINFFITYKSNTTSKTIQLSALNEHFSYENNSHELVGMGSFLPYEVTICCSFAAASCKHKYVSSPYDVSTAEEEPSRAPQVKDYYVYTKQDKSFLFVKWETPPKSTWNGVIIAYEIKYWQNIHNNCTDIINGTVFKYTTNSTMDRQANIPGVLASFTYCFHMRMCTHAGCGPWSNRHTAHEIKDLKISAKKNPLSKDQTVLIAAVSVGLGVALVLMVLGVAIFLKSKRNGLSRPRPLEDYGDLDPTTVALNSSESTELGDCSVGEEDNEYATA